MLKEFRVHKREDSYKMLLSKENKIHRVGLKKMLCELQSVVKMQININNVMTFSCLAHLAYIILLSYPHIIN